MKKRIESLDVIRAIAFIFVYINHAYSKLFCANALGAFAVSIFLVLFGFVNTINYLDKSFNISVKNNFMFMVKKQKRLFFLNAALVFLMIMPDLLEKIPILLFMHLLK